MTLGEAAFAWLFAPISFFAACRFVGYVWLEYVVPRWLRLLAWDAAQCDAHLRASMAQRGPRTVYTEEQIDYTDESGNWA